MIFRVTGQADTRDSISAVGHTAQNSDIISTAERAFDYEKNHWNINRDFSRITSLVGRWNLLVKVTLMLPHHERNSPFWFYKALTTLPLPPSSKFAIKRASSWIPSDDRDDRLRTPEGTSGGPVATCGSRQFYFSECVPGHDLFTYLSVFWAFGSKTYTVATDIPADSICTYVQYIVAYGSKTTIISGTPQPGLDIRIIS